MRFGTALVHDAQAVVGLLVLAPADVADETLIVEVDALAAERDRRIGERRVGELQAIHFVRLRVGDDGIGRLAVHGAVVVGVPGPEHIALGEERGVPRLAGFEAEAGAQRERVGVFGHAGLIDASRSAGADR